MLLADYKVEIEKIMNRLVIVIPKLTNNTEIYKLAKELLHTNQATVRYLSEGGEEGGIGDLLALTEMVRVLEVKVEILEKENIDMKKLIAENTIVILDNTERVNYVESQYSIAITNHIQWALSLIDTQRLIVEQHSFK